MQDPYDWYSLLLKFLLFSKRRLLLAHLQSASQDMSKVRQASCERWPIIKDVLRLALRAAQLFLECIKFVPQRENLLLLDWEAATYTVAKVTRLCRPGGCAAVLLLLVMTFS